MAFLETPRFPTYVALGTGGGPEYATSIVEVNSGRELRKQRWSIPRHRFQVGVGAKGSTELDTLREFHHACLGRFHGFRYKDHNDWKSTQNMVDSVSDTDQTLGTGDSSAATEYQLIKTYTVGSLSLVRTITKPVSGTVVVSLDDVSQASGWSVDTTTGIITFTSAPGIGVVVKAGFEFDVPVRFESDSLTVQQISPGVEMATVGLIELLEE